MTTTSLVMISIQDQDFKIQKIFISSLISSLHLILPMALFPFPVIISYLTGQLGSCPLIYELSS